VVGQCQVGPETRRNAWKRAEPEEVSRFRPTDAPQGRPNPYLFAFLAPWLRFRRQGGGSVPPRRPVAYKRP
jgi:hypothetical protein